MKRLNPGKISLQDGGLPADAVLQASAVEFAGDRKASLRHDLNPRFPRQGLEQREIRLVDAFDQGLRTDEAPRRKLLHGRKPVEPARRGAVHDMQVIIENTIMPSLKLLAEGQKTILETMAPKTRVDELEDEMQLLKAVIRSQSERIAALEKRLA